MFNVLLRFIVCIYVLNVLPIMCVAQLFSFEYNL